MNRCDLKRYKNETTSVIISLFRYDGIYKVKRYWQETGRSSFKVWRYEFIRDDPSPAPWTEEGKAIIEREGYTCIMRDPEQNKKTAVYIMQSNMVMGGMKMQKQKGTGGMGKKYLKTG